MSGHPTAFDRAHRLGCAIAIAACGSSNSASSGTGSGDTLALAFANCMRAHGVPSFPDPGASHSPGGALKQAPAFRSAMQTCNKLQGGGAPHGDIRPGGATHRRARSGEVHSGPRSPELSRSDVPEHRRGVHSACTRVRPSGARVQARRRRVRGNRDPPRGLKAHSTPPVWTTTTPCSSRREPGARSPGTPRDDRSPHARRPRCRG